MVKIAICDDDQLFCNQIEMMTNEEFAHSIDLEIFYSGESLLQKMQRENIRYSIVLLDIEMSGMNGLAVAKKLKQIDAQLLIIYLTNHEEYSLESYETHPYHYLLKSFSKEKEIQVIQSALNQVEHTSAYLCLNKNHETYQFKMEDIVLVSSHQGRKLELVFTDGQLFECYGQLKEVYPLLKKSDFIQINRSVVVNLTKVRKMSSNWVELCDGTCFSISRRQKGLVEEAYIAFVKRRVFFR